MLTLRIRRVAGTLHLATPPADAALLAAQRTPRTGRRDARGQRHTRSAAVKGGGDDRDTSCEARACASSFSLASAPADTAPSARQTPAPLPHSAPRLSSEAARACCTSTIEFEVAGNHQRRSLCRLGGFSRASSVDVFLDCHALSAPLRLSCRRTLSRTKSSSTTRRTAQAPSCWIRRAVHRDGRRLPLSAGRSRRQLLPLPRGRAGTESWRGGCCSVV